MANYIMESFVRIFSDLPTLHFFTDISSNGSHVLLHFVKVISKDWTKSCRKQKFSISNDRQAHLVLQTETQMRKGQMKTMHELLEALSEHEIY